MCASVCIRSHVSVMCVYACVPAFVHVHSAYCVYVCAMITQTHTHTHTHTHTPGFYPVCVCVGGGGGGRFYPKLPSYQALLECKNLP